jgi:hypothetical protein
MAMAPAKLNSSDDVKALFKGFLAAAGITIARSHGVLLSTEAARTLSGPPKKP